METILGIVAVIFALYMIFGGMVEAANIYKEGGIVGLLGVVALIFVLAAEGL